MGPWVMRPPVDVDSEDTTVGGVEQAKPPPRITAAAALGAVKLLRGTSGA